MDKKCMELLQNNAQMLILEYLLQRYYFNNTKFYSHRKKLRIYQNGTWVTNWEFCLVNCQCQSSVSTNVNVTNSLRRNNTHYFPSINFSHFYTNILMGRSKSNNSNNKHKHATSDSGNKLNNFEKFIYKNNNNKFILADTSYNKFESAIPGNSTYIANMNEDEAVNKIFFIVAQDHPNVVINEDIFIQLRESISNWRDTQVLKDPVSTRIIKMISVDGYVKFIVENIETYNWIKACMATLKGLNLVVSETKPTVGSLTRCTIRIRQRKKALDEQGFFGHLNASNPGLNMNGSIIYDVQPQVNGYKLVIMGVTKPAIDWLTGVKGYVYYDVERTKILWDGLRNSLEGVKKMKFSAI